MQTMREELTGWSWQLVGGHPALDLANTVSWRHDPERRLDRLSDALRLADWLDHVPNGLPYAGEHSGDAGPSALLVTQAQESEGAGEVVAAVRTLRDSFTRILDAQLNEDPIPEAAFVLVEDAWRQALQHSSLVRSLPTRWKVDPQTTAPALHVLALVVGDFLAAGDLSRLKRCDGEGCAWFFLDTSRNHSRRWCDPTDCGNRTRVRRYAKRHAPRPPVTC